MCNIFQEAFRRNWSGLLVAWYLKVEGISIYPYVMNTDFLHPYQHVETHHREIRSNSSLILYKICTTTLLLLATKAFRVQKHKYSYDLLAEYLVEVSNFQPAIRQVILQRNSCFVHLLYLLMQVLVRASGGEGAHRKFSLHRKYWSRGVQSFFKMTTHLMLWKILRANSSLWHVWK